MHSPTFFGSQGHVRDCTAPQVFHMRGHSNPALVDVVMAAAAVAAAAVAVVLTVAGIAAAARLATVVTAAVVRVLATVVTVVSTVTLVAVVAGLGWSSSSFFTPSSNWSIVSFWEFTCCSKE